MKKVFLVAALALIAPPVWPHTQEVLSQSPDEELGQLEKAFNKAQEDFLALYRQTKTEEEQDAVHLDIRKSPAREFLPKFRRFAEQAGGSEAGAKALLWICRNSEQAGDRNAAKEAMKTLLDTHIESPALGDLAERLRWGVSRLVEEDVESSLRKIAEQSPHPSVQAAALHSLACVLTDSGRPDALGPDPRTLGRREEAKTLLKLIQRKFPNTEVAKRAAGDIFEIENLQVGMVAPDFTATDQDGKEFKLSEYRGKVVVLDFWGFW